MLLGPGLVVVRGGFLLRVRGALDPQHECHPIPSSAAATVNASPHWRSRNGSSERIQSQRSQGRDQSRRHA